MNANVSDPVSKFPLTLSDRYPEELKEEIQSSKEAITDTIKRLDQHVHRAVDWRAQVGDHPFIALGAAAAAGMLLAGMFRPRPSPGDRIVDAVAETIEDLTDTVRRRIGAQLTRTVTGAVVRTTATALVTKKVADYLLNLSTPIAKDRAEFE